jgi:hypothetical protein
MKEAMEQPFRERTGRGGVAQEVVGTVGKEGQGRQARPVGGGVGDERTGFEDRDGEKWFDLTVT